MKPGSAYNAFISYSHAADGKLAPALRNGLQRFGTAWGPLRWANPVRSLRIFQDQASLSADPALWTTIEKALGASEWFILLASAQSAQSPWVEREVDFWCRNKPRERLLIVQTEGDINWSHADHDFDWARTTALPRRLSAVFPEEPRWIDARWARTGAQAAAQDPRFRDLVAELAAPMRGVSKDELIGEDIRQFHRLNYWRNVALAVTTLLLVIAIAAGVVAFVQRTEAIDQRNAASEQRDQAQRNESRAFAVLATAEAAAGSSAAALRIALAGLPQSIVKRDRPHTLEAEAAAIQALMQLRELRRIKQEEPVTSFAFSPDGRTLATGSVGTSARLWDLATGKEIATLQGEKYFAFSLAFSPDGRTLATLRSLDDTVTLWEVATRRRIVTVPGTSVAFSPDSRTLLTAPGRADDKARLWEATSGRELAVLQAPGTCLLLARAAFSPDGTKVLIPCPDDMTARVWETASGRPLAVLRGHSGKVRWAVFSPDGTRALTASDDMTARVWDAASGQQRNMLRHEGGVHFARFSRDGTKIVTASSDRTARLWDAATGRQIFAWGHQGGTVGGDVSPDGRMVATVSNWDTTMRSGDNTVRLWDATTGRQIAALGGHEGPVDFNFSPDGRVIATVVSEDTAVRIWNATAEGTEIPVVPHSDTGSAVFSPDGTKGLSARYDGATKEYTTHLWNVASGNELGVFRGRPESFSPDGTQVLTALSDNTVRLWDTANGKELALLRGQPKVAYAAISPDGTKALTVCEDHTARLWDLMSAKELFVFRHKAQVSSAVFSRDGTRILTASFDDTARLWDVVSGKELAVLQHGGFVRSAVFSPDGTKILSADWDHAARLWDSASGKELAVLRHRGDRVDAVFSPDGTKILSVSWENPAQLWDTASGKELAVLRGHEIEPGAIAFSPDGRTVATGSQDNTARLWDAASGRELAVLRHRGQISSVAFSPDGGTLATVSDEVRLWPVGQRLIDYGCARVKDLPLTNDNQRGFGIEKEWCTAEVSAALRVKLGMDVTQTTSAPAALPPP